MRVREHYHIPRTKIGRVEWLCRHYPQDKAKFKAMRTGQLYRIIESTILKLRPELLRRGL